MPLCVAHLSPCLADEEKLALMAVAFYGQSGIVEQRALADAERWQR